VQVDDQEGLREALRDTEVDMKFYRRLVKMLMKDDEIARIKYKSTYDDDDWQVPHFVLKAKEVQLPRLNGAKVVEQEKENRHLEFVEDGLGQGSTEGDSSDDQVYQKTVSKTSNEGFVVRRDKRHDI